ncbi:hypothetical protein TNCV_2873531 [Trichonephila clavipes]|nr:hypothetical protein TNCV_2873531 [Trichonephila clavipes]
MITDNLKRRVPGDVREQFVENWVTSIVPEHLALECPKNTRNIPICCARSNIITAKGTKLEFTKEVITARVSIPVSGPINTRNGINDLRKGMEEFRKETENETRLREARHEQARLKAEVEARLKAEEETKAVEKRRRMEEERRMNETISLGKKR